jgi:hypothetical protein
MKAEYLVHGTQVAAEATPAPAPLTIGGKLTAMQLAALDAVLALSTKVRTQAEILSENLKEK